jgi:peptidyl-prolyl cis-trans isomerase A (cyclophilin A)/peptidyl-prolyl cis-trans isomerase B (cyclophilin B)
MTKVRLLTWLALTLACAVAQAEGSRVRFETTAGAIVIQLDADRAPLTVRNFLQYVKEGFYDSMIFHRVVTGFVIQGGGYTRDLAARPPTHGPVPNESGNGLSNRRGTIALARSNDPHSGDAQFYINLADNLSLDPKPTRWGYAVFGEVVEGMNVVDDIGHRATRPDGPMKDLPVEPVAITKVTIVSGGG